MFNFTEEDIKIFTEMIHEELGVKMGDIYVSWYLENVKSILKEWFKGDEYSEQDIVNNYIDIAKLIDKKFEEYVDENFSEVEEV
jgi:hypothetical protein